MGVIDNIMSAVALPFLSKICDEVSRPAGLAVGMTLFCTGYIIVAAAPNIYAVAAGQAVFTAGRTGIYQICHILICDMTQLRWRGLVIACYSLPWVVNGFCAGKIAVSLTVFSSGDGWRWGVSRIRQGG